MTFRYRNAVRANVHQLRGYLPGEQPTRPGEYIKINSNENPYPPSPRVKEALRDAVDNGLRVYPDPLAQELRIRAAAVYGLQPNQVLVGNGSDDLLTILLRTCIGPGDRVAYPVPTYSLYDVLVAMQDGVAVRLPFPEDFRLPTRLFDCDAKLTFVCNPNAPSGTVVPLADLDDLARRVSGVLVIDEAYVDFAEETALALLGRYPHVVILRTFSKSFSLAGLRIGLAFAHAGFVEELCKVKDSYNVNRLSLVAASAALEDYEWMQNNVCRIRATRERLSSALRGLGYFVYRSQANFVLARKRGTDQKSVYLGLRERGILVRYFSSPDLADCLRIAVGTDEQIDRLLAVMQTVCEASVSAA